MFVSSTLGGNQYRIINAGTVTVFLGYGTDGASDASNNAVVSVLLQDSSFPLLLAGTDEILTFVPNCLLSQV
jgi:hypothetical protein